MTEKLTYEKILLLFKESREQMEATRKQMEADRKQMEADREAERKQMEADREAERKQMEADREAERKQMEATREQRAKELDERFKKTEALVDRVCGRVGEIGNNNGTIAEEYFTNALKDKKMFANVRFDYFDQNVKGRVGKIEDEFDGVFYNCDAVGIVEVKHKAHINDLEKLITKKVSNFRTIFPAYKDYKFYLGLASFAFNKEIREMAREMGICLLGQQAVAVESDTSFIKAY